MRKKRILFIDDEPYEMKSIRDALEHSERYEVSLAQTGDEALKIIHSGKEFDLFILDVIMPSESDKRPPENNRTTGLRIAKEIRKKFPRTPIICLSVVTDRWVKNQMRELGAYYIEKPALPSEVLEEVEFFLGRKV
ncbi:MAG: response regulator transcription factor [Candidatus Poribacteria bacterium]